jgi:dTDP-4-amino-4,6-dideoxygalactose transaminase
MIRREIPWWKTSMGERESEVAHAAITAANVTMGPIVPQLERAIGDELGIPYVLATSSGSGALVMSLMALGVGPGDEVIVPNRTFIATANAVLLLGARVVLADVRPDLPLLDIDCLAKKITPRTKVIVAVHLNGRSVAMQELNRLAEQHGISVIEDACQAMFSRNESGYLGTQSRIGCYSLGITKLISSGYGGVAVTRDVLLYERMKLLRNQGLEDTLTCEYQHPGFNFKYSDILAAIALVQLAKKEEKIRGILAIYNRYVEAVRELPDLEILPVGTEWGELPLYVQVLTSRRDELMEFLKSEGIQTRKAPPDLSAAPYLAASGPCRTTRFAQQILILPCGPDQPLANVEYVLDALRRFRSRPGCYQALPAADLGRPQAATGIQT